MYFVFVVTIKRLRKLPSKVKIWSLWNEFILFLLSTNILVPGHLKHRQ